ncbi:unnamed protein product [Mytilus coruscus]|uniref:Uncharacterized protein n=1 Tax=Mytilus coruscus TaxID=42192 RepID=A0A6J8BPE1_MYTCO|nr:unnamed protein product [Mytilus coruscus]
MSSKDEDIVGEQYEDSIMETPERKRIRKLNKKGLELYEKTKDAWVKKLPKTWTRVETFFSQLAESDSTLTLEQLKIMESDIVKLHTSYQSIFDDYIGFLLRTNSVESVEEMKLQTKIIKAHESAVEINLRQIDQYKKSRLEASTVRSQVSRLSRKSGSDISQSSSLLQKNTC